MLRPAVNQEAWPLFIFGVTPKIKKNKNKNNLKNKAIKTKTNLI